MPTPSQKLGLENFDLTDNGRRKKNIGNIKYQSTLKPPDKNPTPKNIAVNGQAKSQLYFLIPKWKNTNWADIKKKAHVVSGTPSITFSIAKNELKYKAQATIPEV